MPSLSTLLDAVYSQYYADLVSWGAIGARTTESQTHRELASGLSCPIGCKNDTNGNLQIAIDTVFSSIPPHSFIGSTEEGQIVIFQTSGNSETHVIFRRGKTPNYDRENVT